MSDIIFNNYLQKDSSVYKKGVKYNYIKKYINKESTFFGKLIQRPFLSTMQDKIWHYAVMISDECAISWNPKHGNPQLDDGSIYFHSFGGFNSRVWKQNKYEFTKMYESSEPQIIYERILASPSAFQSWMYSVYGYNCEHFARLISSGKPDSYQVREKFFGLAEGILDGAVFIKPEAYDTLHAKIEDMKSRELLS